MICIDCEIEISVRPRLVSDQRIDAPTTSNPDRAAGFLKADEYREHLRDIHAHQCLRHRLTITREGDLGVTKVTAGVGCRGCLPGWR